VKLASVGRAPYAECAVAKARRQQRPTVVEREERRPRRGVGAPRPFGRIGDLEPSSDPPHRLEVGKRGLGVPLREP
jgi:hypothetical protein